MKIFLILSSFFLVFYLFSIKSWLPYKLEISNVDQTYYINEKLTGFPCINDNDHIGYDKKMPFLTQILKYTTNSLGLVVYVGLKQGGYRYVSIRPQPLEKQVYAEILWDYKIYTPEEYEALDLGWSWWHTINFE
jgi:hypothetical protein